MNKHILITQLVLFADYSSMQIGYAHAIFLSRRIQFLQASLSFDYGFLNVAWDAS